MEPVKVSKSVIVDLIRELFDKPAEKDIEAPRPRGIKVQPISANPVVDPMASITDPDNKKFAPQNKAEFQVAMGHIDLPEEKFDDLYKKINQTIKDLRKESETSSINTKTMKKDKENKKMANSRRDTQAEAFVRMQIRNILRETRGDNVKMPGQARYGRNVSRSYNPPIDNEGMSGDKIAKAAGFKSQQSSRDFMGNMDNKLKFGYSVDLKTFNKIAKDAELQSVKNVVTDEFLKKYFNTEYFKYRPPGELYKALKDAHDENNQNMTIIDDIVASYLDLHPESSVEDVVDLEDSWIEQLGGIASEFQKLFNQKFDEWLEKNPDEYQRQKQEKSEERADVRRARSNLD